MGRPKEILTGENTTPVQGEFPGTERKRIPAIEAAAAKYDEKRGIIGKLDDELKNFAFKLSEAMHEHKADLEHEESPSGEAMLVYRIGDYNISVKTKESLLVKIKDKSKGSEPGAPDEDEDRG